VQSLQACQRCRGEQKVQGFAAWVLYHASCAIGMLDGLQNNILLCTAALGCCNFGNRASVANNSSAAKSCSQ
jgi:hypothetical protein